MVYRWFLRVIEWFPATGAMLYGNRLEVLLMGTPFSDTVLGVFFMDHF